MALIRVHQAIKNSIWSVTFVNDIEKLSEADKQAMQNFGEPEIDLGGTFLEDTANEFTLPAKKAKIRSDFPFTQTFDAKSSDFETNTKTKVEAYRTEIISRITTALEELRAEEDSFTGEFTFNI